MVLRHHPLAAPARENIVTWSLDNSRVGYSALDYLALIAHRDGLDTQWLQDYIGSTKHLICSQFVDTAYQAAGVHLFTDNRWPGFVTPLDLGMLLLSKGATVRA